jgi:hypothetical protein
VQDIYPVVSEQDALSRCMTSIDRSTMEEDVMLAALVARQAEHQPVSVVCLDSRWQFLSNTKPVQIM